jgi:hypothetical protein
MAGSTPTEQRCEIIAGIGYYDLVLTRSPVSRMRLVTGAHVD